VTVRLRFLGGVGEFGRNCLLLDDEEWGAALVVDCGLKFIDQLSEGERNREILLPDFGPLAAAGERLVGYVLTHGHDDHIGGLPHAVAAAPAPLYATPFTQRRIRRRFSRDSRRLPELMSARVGSSRKVGPFTVHFLAVSHSIPDSAAVVIETSAGRVVHSGDWRVDRTPVMGPPTDLEGLRAACDDGVRLLLADSTGAPIEGDNPGERSVEAGLSRAFEGVSGRLYIATFASHVQRVALIAELCRRHKRRLVLVGRGMRDNVHAAEELGLLGIDDVALAERDAFSVPAQLQCAVVTGTQGEPNSALERIAKGSHARFAPRAGDRVVLSARVIPGNEEAVDNVTGALMDRGVEVWNGEEGRHVSGHGFSGDLRALIDAVRPDIFCPVHGEPHQLEACAALGRAADCPQVISRINGDEVRLETDRVSSPDA